MPSQAEKAARFAALHQPGNPIVLFNIWDAGSARAVEAVGASALATGSHPIANALGLEDGEGAPLEDMLWVLSHICAATDLPVSHDTERGYGATPGEVAETCKRVIETGAIGVNIEDSLDAVTLRDLDEQVARYAAARAGLDAACPGAWLNARCDAFRAMKDAPVEVQITEIVRRAVAYKAAGADSLFVPFQRDLAVLAQVCAAVDLPVNLFRGLDSPPIGAFAAAGAARISHGHNPWVAAMERVGAKAGELYTD
ncbi:MAG: isocitrate lyase/phosphoenolpyruvate mutase family protein [Hyphomonadaceae bacterium]|nr:isocitrate lyase/phosphoenolpyruvate mutase family protein [Hyphomonadaceae bacterium]